MKTLLLLLLIPLKTSMAVPKCKELFYWESRLRIPGIEINLDSDNPIEDFKNKITTRCRHRVPPEKLAEQPMSQIVGHFPIILLLQTADPNKAPEFLRAVGLEKTKIKVLIADRTH